MIKNPRNTQYKHQLAYFNKEFSKNSQYKLAAWQENFIDRIKKHVLDRDFKNKTAIDIATGSGYAAIEMAKLGMKVIATDLSPYAIKNLRKYQREMKLKNMKLIVCKAEKIPIKDNSVDYLLANAIIEHIPDEEKTIREWKRILKPNGKMFITVPIRFKFVWPFLWPVMFFYDKRLGHLRRYDLEILQKRFALKTTKFFYTGHFVKVLGVLISILFRTNKFDEFIEKMDQGQENKKYGANNITVIFKNEK